MTHGLDCTGAPCGDTEHEQELVARVEAAISRMLEAFAAGSPERAASALRIAAVAVNEGSWKDWLGK